MDLPLISVVILTYKRQDALLQAIDSVVQQVYPHFEVIVVDNHSEDGTPELVRQKFPQVRSVSLSENLGGAGRNAGFTSARGEIVVTLDNDVHFYSPLELSKAATLFQKKPEVACFTFRVLQFDNGALSVRDWCHPRSHEEFANVEFPTYYIAEGASAFRKDAVSRSGGYDERLFLGHEGFDLALRLFRLGYEIHYTPEVVVRHQVSAETRTLWRPYFYNTRNYFILAWKHFRIWFGLHFLGPRIGMMFFFALRTGNVRYYLRGIVAGIKERKSVLRSRVPMTSATERIIRELSAHRPGLRSRFRRHAKKPLL